MKKLILFCFIFCICFSQEKLNDKITLKKYNPVFEIGVGFPWLTSISGGIKVENHKILLNIKSMFIYHELSSSYHHSINDNFSVGIGLNRIIKTPLFKSNKKEFTVLSPQISYVFNSKNSLNNKELKMGFEISRNSQFGLSNNNNTFFMPFFSLHMPINFKKNNAKRNINTIKNNDLIPPLFDTNKSEENNNNLNRFEKSIQNNTDLLNKYSQFKKGPIENNLTISNKQMEKAISKAKSFLGTPYSFGGINKNGIDCSGLFFVAFNHQGIEIPRVAQDIAKIGRFIYGKDNLLRGDFVFFANTTSANKLITHMGLYLGNEDFIHSSSTKGVVISKINDPYYWKNKFLFGKRILK